MLQDLAGRTGRQGIQHDDVARPLVWGELSGSMCHQILRLHSRARQQLHERDDFLVAREGAPDYCRLNNRRMLVQYRFDLGRIDIEARADDQLLGAADDVKNVVFEPREIAGIEPAISVDHRCGLLEVSVIAAHDIGTADVQFADLAWRDSATTRLYQARLDPRDQ